MERTQYWHEINGINYSDVKFLDIYDDTVEIIAQVRTETPPYVIASSGNQLIVYHVKIENNERMSLHEIKRIQHDGDVRQIKVLFPKFRKFQSQTKSQSCALFTTSSNGTLQGFVIHIVKKEQDIDVKHRLVQSWKLHDLSCDCLDICLSQNHDEFTVVTGGEDGVINVLHLTKNLPITDKDFKYSTKEITQKIHTGRPITSIRYQIRDGIAGIAANQKVRSI
jgi:WD40 repeat protein